MKTKINKCMDMYTLRDVVHYINATYTQYTHEQLLNLDDLIRKQEVKIRSLIREYVLDLRDLAQQLFDWKEYDFSNVYTEFAEEYIQELEVNIWG